MSPDSSSEIRRAFAEEAGTQLVAMGRALQQGELGALRSSASSLRSAAHAQGLRLVVDLLDAIVVATDAGDADAAALRQAVDTLQEVLPSLLRLQQSMSTAVADMVPSYVEPPPEPLPESAIPAPLRSQRVEPRSVVVADDSPTTRRIHADALQTAGFDVRTARDGSAALRQLAGDVPDVVVTDFDMAPMNGPQLIRAMREDARLGSVPVVLVSARKPAEVRELLDGLDVAAIVSKTDSTADAVVDAAVGASGETASNGAPRARILVAEDSDILRRVISDQLTAAGYEVLEASDGEEAIEIARAQRPDVALLDREMPKVDGMRALAVFKGQPETAQMPVVFVTGRVSPDELAEGLDRGAHDYVRKPVQPAELLARVRTALRLRKLHYELAARNDELEALSQTDVLTGLTNRRHAAHLMDAAVGTTARYGRQMSAVMMDVDHFKSVNDEHGHGAGDEVLRAVADVMRRTLRIEDTPARWGGEEFLVILPDIALDGAEMAAERLRSALAAEPVVCEGTLISVTASFGVAEWMSGEDAEALIARADQALYDAKAAGRDRVCVAVAA